MQDPDDDARLAAYADALVVAVDAAIAGWVERSVHTRCAEAGIPVEDSVVVAAGERCRDQVVGELRMLLSVDVDQQAATPLQVLRAAVRHPTAVLDGLGVPPVERDEFERRAFPDDLYALTPAGFADVDPALVDAGVAWGAAKAHVHRSRHAR